jgi:hypothetical protein
MRLSIMGDAIATASPAGLCQVKKERCATTEREGFHAKRQDSAVIEEPLSWCEVVCMTEGQWHWRSGRDTQAT